ncbi:InlB B-repeat-containing protein, partial [Butyrivibrio sp. DSM 10294]|uniref:InlB B-repeat-containing protein n=1 Tax=Butyrivibrio sp. DSM 10294 TaxID=2972457 RepID=UPI00234F94C9
MLNKSKKLLAFMLSIALVFTTFGSDLASAVAYAEDEAAATEASAVEEKATTWDEIVEEVPGTQDESGGGNEDTSGETDESSDDAQGEDTPADTDEGEGGAVDVPENPTPEEPAEGGEAENPTETPSEASTESTIDAADAASIGSSSSEDATEASSEAASEASSEDASEASSEASSEDASEASSEASSEDAAAEASSVEEMLVTVRYTATDGGRVSRSKETVDLKDEDDKFKGSTATADDYYGFVEWVDEDGNTVCEDATFVPSDIEEDATFTAVFEEIVKKPAVSFSRGVDGLNVFIDAPEGAFPEGTEVIVTPVYDQEVLDAATDVVDGDAKKAVAVDITFTYKDKEIEPLVPITVKFFSNDIKEADDTNVVHIGDDGDAKVLDNVDVGNNSVEFDSSDFSIYVIVISGEDARLEVVFKKGEDTIASMFVKSGDTMDMVIYDPGVGNLPDGVMFKGWTRDPGYLASEADEKGLTIDKVRQEVVSLLPPNAEITDGDQVVYYAMLIKPYTVTYLDEGGTALGRHVVNVRADASGEDKKQEYIVNMNYTPINDEHAFEGWFVVDGQDNILTVNGDPYVYDPEGTVQNTDKLVITDSIVLSVNSPLGHWLIFDENGKGGKYNAPQFVKDGEVTKEPCDRSVMTRYGYNFVDWYEAVYLTEEEAGEDEKAGTPKYDANGKPVLQSTPFSFGGEIDKTTYLFAVWENKTNAPYTVIIWTQNKYDRTKYDIADVFSYDFGEVGHNIPYRRVDNGDEDYAVLTDAPARDSNKYHFTGFNLKTDIEDVKVTPEGDAVLNLYYDRIEYDLRFYYYREQVGGGNNRYSYAQNSGGGSSLNDLATWYGGASLAEMPTQTYGTVSSQREGNYNYYYFTLHAYYGQEIEDIWPQYTQISGPANNREPVSFIMMVGTKLKPNPTNQGSGTVKGVITVLDENILGATNDSDGNYMIIRFNTYFNWRYHIWFETIPGVEYPAGTTRTYQGKTYYEDHVVESRSSNTTVANQNEPNYTGFTYNTVRGQNWNDAAYWNTTEGNTTLYHINHIYTRNMYNIEFMEGRYYKDKDFLYGRENNILRTSDPIAQHAAIPAEYKNYVPNLPQNEEGYVFGGWYTDGTCTVPFDFDNAEMQVGGIQVYAKWYKIQYRVFLYPNAGTDPTLDWGSETQETSFRGNYGERISTPTGIRAGYVFSGWYTDPDFNNLFNDQAYVLNDNTVTRDYDTSKPTEGRDKWGNGGTYNKDVTDNRFWITRELDLYAKWSKILEGSNGIKVTYVKEDPRSQITGIGNPVDANLYVDNADATAVAALKSPDEKYQFSHWMMQKANDAGDGYVDEGTVIYPGEKFKVLAQNAIVDVISRKPDGTIDKANYTIQLRPVFTKVEEATPTFIPWYKNDGTDCFHTDKIVNGENALLINEAVEIQPALTREGYRFLGWAKVRMGASAEEVEAFRSNSGNWTQALGTSNLFLYYDADSNKFFSDAAKTKVAEYVAADEEMPYQALFAVWEEGKKIIYTDGVENETVFDDQTYRAFVGEATPKFQAADGTNEPTRPGYKFMGWNPGWKDTVDGDQTYTATWEVDNDQTYIVNYFSKGNGTVDPTKEGPFQVLSNDDVMGSKAEPAPGYRFKAWYKTVGDNDTLISGAVAVLSSALAKQYLEKDGNIFADTNYTAEFEVDPDQTYKVEYVSDNITMGTVTNPADEGLQVLSTEGVTGSKAEAKPGYRFVGWIRDGDSEPVSTAEEPGAAAFKAMINKDEVNSNLYTDTKFIAKFEVDAGKTYVVNYYSKGNGTVDPTKEGPFQVLTSDGIEGSKAEPAPGYRFKAWYKTVGDNDTLISGAVAVLSSALAKQYLEKDGNIFADTNYTAEFEADPDQTYKVEYVSDNITMGTVTNPADEGLQVLSTDGVKGSKAEAKPGYEFVGWFRDGDNAGVSSEADPGADAFKAQINKDAEHTDLYADTKFVAKFQPDNSKQYNVIYTAKEGGTV